MIVIHKKDRKSWGEDIERLKEMAELGLTVYEMSRMLGRPTGSIRYKCQELGLKIPSADNSKNNSIYTDVMPCRAPVYLPHHKNGKKIRYEDINQQYNNSWRQWV